jgi:hypothetical protein
MLLLARNSPTQLPRLVVCDGTARPGVIFGRAVLTHYPTMQKLTRHALAGLSCTTSHSVVCHLILTFTSPSPFA